MKQFNYVIRHPLGMHARPAGQLVRLAREYVDTEITVAKGEVQVKATQLIRLMGMGIRQGTEITVTAEGPGEDEAIAAIQQFLEENL